MGLKEPLRFSHSGFENLFENLKKFLSPCKDFSYEGKIIVGGDLFVFDLSFYKQKIQVETSPFEGYLLDFKVKRYDLSPWEETVFLYTAKELFCFFIREGFDRLSTEFFPVTNKNYFYLRARLLKKKQKI